ncbi:MAG: DNA-processing protein DprA [bacterium]
MKEDTIEMIMLNDKRYPKLLRQINDPPARLYFRGNIEICNYPSVAVVGSRKYSPYGKQSCELITSNLASANIVIVSGLALGIDGIAHQSALNKNGLTVAVLGTGIDDDTIYPASNFQLAKNILKNNGLIISECAPGEKPTKYCFPKRNRIIAGLSLGTLVIEAATRSGALITARCALDYNRDVFAVPHQITSPAGKGANNLIKQGARLVEDADDIIECLNLQGICLLEKTNKLNKKETAEKLTDEIEKRVFICLSDQPKHIDEIIRQTQLDSQTVGGKISLLELKGLASDVGGMNYIINYN